METVLITKDIDTSDTQMKIPMTMQLIIITGGETEYLMRINGIEMSFHQPMIIGQEEDGGKNTGGGIEKEGSQMEKNTDLPKEIMGSGMASLTRKKFLHIIWISLLLGSDIIKNFQGYGGKIGNSRIGWCMALTIGGTLNSMSIGDSSLKEKANSGGSNTFLKLFGIKLIKKQCKEQRKCKQI